MESFIETLIDQDTPACRLNGYCSAVRIWVTNGSQMI